MCFIDNMVSRHTLDILVSIKDYAKDEEIDVECELLAVAIDWGGKENQIYEFFQEKYKEENISLTRCDLEENLKKEIESRKNSGILFMVDLHLRKNEEDSIDNQSEYKCQSMKVIDWISGEEFHLYSMYTEDLYKDKWCKRFKELYCESEEPTIIAREKLQPGSFNIKTADEILGVSSI